MLEHAGSRGMERGRHRRFQRRRHHRPDVEERGDRRDQRMADGAHRRRRQHPSTPPAAGWNLIASGDFNGDGTDDLMWQNAATGATSEWLMAPDGGMASNPCTPAAPGWDVVATGDFNGDGTTDLMWQNAAPA